MKKTFAIIIAAAALLGSLATAIWYTLDGDPATTPDVQKVVDDGKNLYNAIVTSDDASAAESTDSQTEGGGAEQTAQ